MERELFKVLEQSIERHGKDKVLTLGHLYNILKLAQERAEIRAEQEDIMMSQGIDHL